MDVVAIVAHASLLDETKNKVGHPHKPHLLMSLHLRAEAQQVQGLHGLRYRFVEGLVPHHPTMLAHAEPVLLVRDIVVNSPAVHKLSKRRNINAQRVGIGRRIEDRQKRGTLQALFGGVPCNRGMSGCRVQQALLHVPCRICYVLVEVVCREVIGLAGVFPQK